MKKGFPPTLRCITCEACCKALPGFVFPEDIKEPQEDTIIGMLQSGNYAIDWWVGDIKGKGKDQCYILRPSIKGTNKLFDPAWGGECTFLTKKGCKLSFEERPKGCRVLEPTTSGPCKYHSDNGGSQDKESAAIAWYELSEWLKNLGESVNELVQGK